MVGSEQFMSDKILATAFSVNPILIFKTPLSHRNFLFPHYPTTLISRCRNATM